MTGTVLDGRIDVALLRTDGEHVEAFGPWRLVPYDRAVVSLLEESVATARRWRFEGPEPAIFAEATRAASEAQSDAVREVLEAHAIEPDEVSTIGFHGQTVLHRAPTAATPGRTRQLADGALMAERLGIDVVVDFRSGDVRLGGQGAPLSAVYHRALMRRIGAAPGTVFLNLGGVANLTCDTGERLVAFDTGPANAPIDDWVRRHSGEPMDTDGRLAQAGTVDEGRLARLLEHPYLATPYPKSLDRFDFPASMVDGLDLADGAATLTAFAAAAVARALAALPIAVGDIVVCGGGRHNRTLMRELGARSGAIVHPAEAVGLRGDAIEAECFAFLAERSRRGLPISYPETTGTRWPATGGTLHRGRRSARTGSLRTTTSIRAERPADAPAIEAVTANAFADVPHAGGTEPLIVAALRRAGQLSVSLVAERAGEIVGHVAVSPIELSDGSDGWFGLGPISVLERLQGRGIGTELMGAAIAELRGLGARGCVLLGDPRFYARFGFYPSASLTLPDIPPQYFQALLLLGEIPTASVAFHDAFRISP